MSCSTFLWLWSISGQSGRATEGYRLPVSSSAVALVETPSRRG